jgi:hypothetical protein
MLTRERPDDFNFSANTRQSALIHQQHRVPRLIAQSDNGIQGK